MQVIYPKGSTKIPARRRSTEANGVYTICKALDQAGHLFDQEVSICRCRFDIVVYDAIGVNARCVIEVKRDVGGHVADKQRRVYAQFGVPVILARASDAGQIVQLLNGNFGELAGLVGINSAAKVKRMSLPSLRLLRKR